MKFVEFNKREYHNGGYCSVGILFSISDIARIVECVDNSSWTNIVTKDGKVHTTAHRTTDNNGNEVILVRDEKTEIRLSKVDIVSNEELKGATLQLLDGDEVLETWISDGQNAHTFTGLSTGKEYTLRETVAPEGYAINRCYLYDPTGWNGHLKAESCDTRRKTCIADRGQEDKCFYQQSRCCKQ